MTEVVIWALSTGFVTGAVWFAILFYRRGTPDIEALRREQQAEQARKSLEVGSGSRGPSRGLGAGPWHGGPVRSRERDRADAKNPPGQ